MSIRYENKSTENCPIPILGIFKLSIFRKFMIFGDFGQKILDIMMDNYFEKSFWKKSHSNKSNVQIDATD